MSGIEQLVAALDRQTEALARQTEAVNGLLQAFAVLAGEEFGTPAKAEPDAGPGSTMDGEELRFRGQRSA